MISAFGVEHGDQVSKARKPKKTRVRPPNPTAVKVGQKIGAAPKAIANAPLNLNSIGRGTSRAAGAVGSGTARMLGAHPALTGAAVVGGTGYGLYSLGRKKEGFTTKRKPSS